MSNKETIKEVKPKDIQRIIASTDAQTASIEILQLFSQWQAQRMYSEEEVKKLIIDFLFEKGIGREVKNVEEWFEQFKKK